MSHEKSCCNCLNCSCACHKDQNQCHTHHHSEQDCHHHHAHEGSYADQLLTLADEAWEELLKDKIKEEILKTSDANLTQLAQLVSQTNHKRWKEIMAEKTNEEHFRDQLSHILSQQ